MTKKELQLAIYNVLKDRQDWVSQKELIYRIPDLGYYKKGVVDECPYIWKLINGMNLSDEFDCVIMQQNYLYKIIRNEKEGDEYLAEYFKTKCTPPLVRYHGMMNKLKRNGQCSIFNKHIVDTYLRGYNGGVEQDD